jgi:hypothetical protein
MRFWDSSAILPLIVSEAGSARALALYEDDGDVLVWVMTRLEVVTGIERRARHSQWSSEQRIRVLEAAAEVFDCVTEVQDVSAVRSRAMSLVARHSLRAADAAQLGSAVVAAELDTPGLEFVCFDRRLLEAASREGFRVRGVENF